MLAVEWQWTQGKRRQGQGQIEREVWQSIALCGHIPECVGGSYEEDNMMRLMNKKRSRTYRSRVQQLEDLMDFSLFQGLTRQSTTSAEGTAAKRKKGRSYLSTQNKTRHCGSNSIAALTCSKYKNSCLQGIQARRGLKEQNCSVVCSSFEIKHQSQKLFIRYLYPAIAICVIGFEGIGECLNRNWSR